LTANDLMMNFVCKNFL